MINGTEELDSALASLSRMMDVIKEEKWSIDYTYDHAPLAGKILSEKMPLNETVDFLKTLNESTRESRENIDKVLKILNMTAELLDHYKKLSDIGYVWGKAFEKTIDSLRCYQ